MRAMLRSLALTTAGNTSGPTSSTHMKISFEKTRPFVILKRIFYLIKAHETD
jgi:hypothetical protein